LSWTCKIGDDNKVDNPPDNDVNKVDNPPNDDVIVIANKANVHVAEPSVLAPAEEGQFIPL